jgi:hypothetical protein
MCRSKTLFFLLSSLVQERKQLVGRGALVRGVSVITVQSAQLCSFFKEPSAEKVSKKAVAWRGGRERGQLGSCLFLLRLI